jgi:hypothetical protein
MKTKILLALLAAGLASAQLKAASIDEAMDTLARRVGRYLDPIKGQDRTTVVIMEPIVSVSDNALQGQIQSAFTRSFLGMLTQETRNAVTYHDEDYFPRLRDFYTAEFDRILDDPNLARKIFNEYLSIGTYDYLILTRAQAFSSQVNLSTLVIRRDRVVGHPQESVAYGRVAGEAWRMGITAVAYNQQVERSELFLTSGGYVSLPSTPAFGSSGAEFEARGSRVAASYRVLGRIANEQETEDLEYSFSDDLGRLEALPVQWGRFSIFTGYEYHRFSQEYALIRGGIFKSRFTEHSVGLGLGRGNLLNGFFLSVWAQRGESIDDRPGAEVFLPTEHMFDVEGYQARLEYNYSSGRREALFKIQGGKGDVDYDEEYYRAPFIGQSSFYDVSLHLRSLVSG